MIGAPWEIFYIATGQNRGTEIYAKTGNLGAYNTVFGLIPDLGIGFTVNTAHGSESGTDASLTLAGLVMGNFLPAVQAEAKKQAAERFNGIYASQKSNQTITITVDDEAGLAASSPLFTNLIDLALGPGKLNSTQRLFPTGLRTTKQKTGRSDTYVSRLAFRAVIDSLGEEGQNEGVGFSVPCTAWAGVSGLMYGGVSLDEIIFELGEDGNATGITLPVLRETWERK